MSKIDQAVSNVKGIADALTDEIVELENGNQQYVNYINGDPKNKLVIGSSRKGKSIFSDMTEVKNSKLDTTVSEEVITFDPEGAKKYPSLASVEIFLGGVGRLHFSDGTFQFAENESYPSVVHSPRLSEDKLEQFCLDNMSKYEAYFQANFESIDRGDDLPPIERFWE